MPRTWSFATPTPLSAPHRADEPVSRLRQPLPLQPLPLAARAARARPRRRGRSEDELLEQRVSGGGAVLAGERKGFELQFARAVVA